MITAGAIVFALLFGCWVGYSFRGDSNSVKVVDFTDGSTTPLPALLKRLERDAKVFRSMPNSYGSGGQDPGVGDD